MARFPVQITGWFIGKDYFGFIDEGPRDGNTLLLTT